MAKRSDGLWVGQISMGKTAEGKRNRVVVYGHSQAEVEEKLAKERGLMGQGIEKTDETVREYLDYWLDTVMKPNLKPKTFFTYQGIIERYLKPGLGHVQLRKLQPAVIQNFLGALSEQKGRNGRKLTQARLHAWTVLHGALKKAVRLRKLASNPCEAVDPPTIHRRERRIWTIEEVKRFISHARDHEAVFYPVYVLALLGMRQGEIFGLHWSEVDLQRGTIHIAWNLVEHGNKILGRFPSPKSNAGFRTIKLPQSIIPLLAQRKHDNATEKVFPTSNDTYYKKTNIRWRFLRDCVLAGVPAITFHDMRHVFVSYVLNQGADPKATQAQVGHGTMDMTMGHYAHAMDDGKLKIASIVDGLFTEAAPEARA